MKRERGTGSLYRPRGSTIVWCKYHRGGVAYRESTHCKDMRKAAKFLKRRVAEITVGTFSGLKIEKVKVDELADDFLREYRINARKSLPDAETRWRLHLKPFFGDLRAVQVTSDLLNRYVDERQKEDAMNATINRELAALKRMFHLGMAATPPKVIRQPKFPQLQENNVRKGFLEFEHYGKLIAECRELWLRALIATARTYCWRIGELLKLRVGQVDLLGRTIRLDPGTTKNDEGREVTVTDELYDLLWPLITRKQPSDHVFTRKNGKQVKDFRKTWATLCEAAGVPGLLFHDLRRTAARDHRRSGTAEGVIMKLGGWKTRSVFERYAIVSQTDIKDALVKLQKSDSELKKAKDSEFGHNFGHSDSETKKIANARNIN